jgi:hypothetical protein
MLPVFLVVLALAAQTDSSPLSIKDRVNSREYPSVFQAWSGAENLNEDRLTTLARHDLVWLGPGGLGLSWEYDRSRGETAGLATTFQGESVQRARKIRRRLLELNPHLVILLEMRYRDAPPDWFPTGHRWWLRDREGNVRRGWFSHGINAHFLQMDFTNPSYREFLGRRAGALMGTGACDGILLDWWHEDEHRVDLARRVRGAIGKDALIIVNTNRNRCPRSAAYVNGLFMETCLQGLDAGNWTSAAGTLLWAEENLREPRTNCLEIWWKEPLRRRDLKQMRAATALALTHSNGYCLFSDPNPLPTPDHRHDWYPFWDRTLGRPEGAMKKRRDGAFQRQFARGTAVFNPPGNGTVTLTFEEDRTSRATGNRGRRHQVEGGDGDLFLGE